MKNKERARFSHTRYDTAHEMVGNAIRDAETILKAIGTDCILEWNKGNHFKDPDLRAAKAFVWLMNREDMNGTEENRR